MGKCYCTLSSLYLLCTLAVSNKPWLVTSIVLWLSTVLCPVFVANPRPEREGYIRSPIERLDAPAQLSRVYPTSCTCDNIPGFPPRIVESLGTRLDGLCIFVPTPRLNAFWHAVPTSLYILMFSLPCFNHSAM